MVVEVHKECKGVTSGYVSFLNDKVDPKCQAVIKRDIILNKKDGLISKSSKAYK